MTRVKSDLPDVMPVLSRGKHRNSRSGACFMEFASYLAGEAWSDHPKCTHPLLASLARMVNDFTSDENRSRLSILTPSVIGLVSQDPRLSVRIALRAASCALPVASADRQRALAVGIMSCEQALVDLDGVVEPEVREFIDSTFALAPEAVRWAREFVDALGFGPTTKFVRQVTQAIVHTSVEGVAHACISNPDDRMFDMLAKTIDDCIAFLAPDEDIDTRTSGVHRASEPHAAQQAYFEAKAKAEPKPPLHSMLSRSHRSV